MEQILFLREQLLKRTKWSRGKFYPSGILIRNKNVPMFEEVFGQLDQDWSLTAMNDRISSMTLTEELIIHVTDNHLGSTSQYAERDYRQALLYADGDKDAINRIIGSRARRFYQAGNYKMARECFRQVDITIKIFLYYVTSFIPFIANWVKKNYKVSG